MTPEPTLLAFVDCETTGLDPDRHEVWEIAVIAAEHEPRRVESDDQGTSGVLRVTDEWRRQMQPSHLHQADPIALRIGRYWERRDDHVIPYLHHPHVALSVEELTRGRIMVGAVPSFDAAFLSRLLHEHNLPAGWHYQLLDVETLVAGYIAGLTGHPDVTEAWDRDGRLVHHDDAIPPWNSDRLLGRVGAIVRDDDRHTALGDARWAMKAYAAVFNLRVVNDHG